MNSPETWIEKTAEHVKNTLSNEGTGHDWWHILRVWNNAKHIAQHEKANLTTVELTALLHDIADWKFYGGDEKAGSRVAAEWLTKIQVPEEIISKVCHSIDHLSYKGANTHPTQLSIEGKIVQDADRLDAIGAIGIARAFAYGGHAGRALYDPEQSPVLHQNAQEYKRSVSHTINHFYEKLLLLKDRMNTNTARELAQARHEYLVNFLDEFYAE